MVSISKLDNRAEITIEGEMTIFNAQQIASSLEIPDTKFIELDLSQVSEFDTSGLQILFALKKECGLRGIELALKAISEPIKGLLELFRITDYFDQKQAFVE